MPKSMYESQYNRLEQYMKRQIFELIADRAYLKDLCLEKTAEYNGIVNKFSKFKVECRMELLELLDRFREAMEEARNDIEREQIYNHYQQQLHDKMNNWKIEL